MNVLKYKGYEGTAEIEMESMLCRGKILFIDDLVTYQASDPQKLKKEFENAIDDYLETCDYLGREARKPLRGQFNVRISPELHRLAALRAINDNTSLNKVVVNALELYLSGHNEVNQHITFNMEISPNDIHTFAASSSSESKWEEVSNVH